MLKHFLLTRFNLKLWGKDKNNNSIDREAWLHDRVSLFERYTLPSIAAQTCKDFVWVILVDGESPEWFRDKSKAWKEKCPQMHFVAVKAQYQRYFAAIFQDVVSRNVCGEVEGNEEITVLTTYLDNDDAVRTDFVEDVQKQAEGTESDTFLYYDYGLQYFTEIGISTRVYYPNNHFTTLKEHVTAEELHKGTKQLKTCYGYGSHFMIESCGVAKVKHITDRDKPMWVEVVHESNVDNDVKMTFDTKLWVPKDCEYGCQLPMSKSPRISFLTRWFPRMIGQVIRRTKNKM